MTYLKALYSAQLAIRQLAIITRKLEIMWSFRSDKSRLLYPNLTATYGAAQVEDKQEVSLLEASIEAL
jgi:hypothetical protein